MTNEQSVVQTPEFLALAVHANNMQHNAAKARETIHRLDYALAEWKARAYVAGLVALIALLYIAGGI